MPLSGGDVEIVDLQEVEIDSVLSLLARCMGSGAAPTSRDFWTWKHVDNPFGPSPGLAAIGGGEVVALRVFMRWRWSSGSEDHEAVRAVDTATHPRWRRKGLFLRLTGAMVDRLEREGYSFIFNTPNPKSRAGYLKLGWSDVGRVPVGIRVLRPVRAVRAILRVGRDAAADDGIKDPEDWLTLPEAEAGSLGTIAELCDDHACRGFLDGLTGGEGRLHTVKHADFLAWRYGSIPGIDYRALWRIEGDAGAVLVFRPNRRRGLRELTISEILVGGEDGGVRVATTLLKELAHSTNADHLGAVSTPGTPERSALRAAGFLPLSFLGPTLTARPLGGAGSRRSVDPTRMENWRLQLGDLEIF